MMRGKLLAGAIAAMIAGPALATDFTFDIPVSVQNVPLLSQVEVECYVSVLPTGTPGAASPENVVGRGRATVEAPGGSYEGTITVPVENTGILRSADARSYHCKMFGTGRSPSGVPVAFSGSWSTILQRMTGATLTSETLWTEGNF